MKPSATQKQLKQAIQEQLDLILKIEQDRKVLKRQNKSLNQKYIKLTQTLKKYSNTQKSQFGTVTQPQTKAQISHKDIQTAIEVSNRGCQADLITGQQNINTLNNTKLSQAMSFLKSIDTSMQPDSRVIEQPSKNTSNILQNQSLRKMTNQTIIESKQDRNKDKNPQISNQIVKMSKQMTALKRQLKQSQTKSKQRQKQLKEVKKCLQAKSQALQKCRKQFNELSMLLNTDKYKSVRNLEQQNEKLRIKASKTDEQASMVQYLKEMLQKVTLEYSSYRQEKQKKISSLVKQLKEKDQAVEDLQIQLGQFKNELKLMKY